MHERKPEEGRAPTNAPPAGASNNGSMAYGGKRRAGVKIARAQYDEAAANYRQTVLTAFREVEDDLAAQRLLVAGEADQAQATSAAERTRDLALIRYRDGAADSDLEVEFGNASSDEIPD